jgi:hypothetical protein
MTKRKRRASSSSIRTIESLRSHLQEALTIEHAVIPPYLAAWLSIPEGTNQESAEILRSVLLEEMLHMTLVANILIAVKGQPCLTSAGFVPTYPHTLPYSGDRFRISIEKFSRKALNTFLKIEQPTEKGTRPETEGYKTLGQFYAAIRDGIKYLCRRHGEKHVFSGDPELQIPPGAYYGTGKFFVVKDKESALDALREVVTEGEGWGSDVFDEDPDISGRHGQEPAHYYRFQEILKGRYYKIGDTRRTGPRGPRLAVDFKAVYPFRPNTRHDDYPPGSPTRTALEEFSAAYGQLLAAIEDGFNGKPARMNDAVAAMFRVENLGRALMRTPSGKPDGSTLGPCFEQVSLARATFLPSEERHLDRAIVENARAFRKPGVLSVRPGWKIKNGWPTDRRAIVATVEHKRKDISAAARIPATVGPYSTDVREATPKQLARFRDPALLEQMKAAERPESHEPQFSLERNAQTGELLASAPAAASSTRSSHASAAHQPTKPTVSYSPPPNASLDAVTAKMNLICHVSPDAGWVTLKAFLGGVAKRLTVGLYDFTSAHVLDAVLADLADSQKLTLVLDNPTVNPTANQTDEETEKRLASELKARMTFAWAAAGDDRMVKAKIFPTSYHIKVAVKDGKAFWLSSGNWNNSNQPDVDVSSSRGRAAGETTIRDSDRDWHVIVEHDGLAKTFDAYLQNDSKQALKLQNHNPLTDAKEVTPPAPKATGRVPVKFFAPKKFSNVTVKIQPLLTPDQGAGNYASHIADLIRSAKKSVYIQTQYLHPPTPGEAQLAPFRAILDALAAKISAGLDVRIIFSQWETESWLEKVQSAGIPASVVKIQQGVHNKGIVVDSSVVALGSQNWSTDGAMFNRDASLIIFDPNVAQYYEQVFLQDWEHMAEQKVPKFT